jgi:peptidyl-prolyl cis-trans isomerase A (cyclophilin A)
MKTNRFAILASALFAFACAGAFLSLQPANAASGTASAAAARVKISTSEGDIVAVLDAKHAPKTVANFLHYVDGHFYDGGTFFRAVPGFVIQGGNHDREKPSDPQLVLEPTSKTGILNKDGYLSMARTPNPNSATSEFFICDGEQSELDASATSPGYAAFGHVLSGMDVVRKIVRLPAENQQLTTPVKILKIARI